MDTAFSVWTVAAQFIKIYDPSKYLMRVGCSWQSIEHSVYRSVIPALRRLRDLVWQRQKEMWFTYPAGYSRELLSNANPPTSVK